MKQKHNFWNVRNKLILVSLLLFTFLMAIFVVAEVGRLIDLNSINTTAGASNAGGGFVVSGTSGHLTNGSGFPVIQGEYSLNLSGSININVSLKRNLSHGGFVNLTFGWMLSRYNASTILNTTLYNSTSNQTSFNYSFNTNLLLDGIYNVSVYVQNVSTDAAVSVDIVVNFSRGVDVIVDNTPPNVTNFWANVSNTTNLTTVAAKIEVNISTNDSTTYVQTVKIGVRNGTNEMNLTATRNASAFVAVIPINATLGQDRFNVFAYPNDSLGNLNFTNGNFTFTVDGTAPSFNLFHMFGRNGTTVNLTNLSTANADFRFNFTDNLSISANCTLYVNSTLAQSNSSAVNSSAANLTVTNMAEGKHLAYVSCTDGSGNQGNVTDATNALSLNYIIFTVDTIPPNLSAETLVFGNYSGFASHSTGYVGINLSAGLSEGNYTLQVFVNDSSTHPQMVRFNLTNSSGSVSGSVYPFNHTAVKNESNYTTASTGAGDTATRGNLNISRLAEGWYNLTVWTNDSVDNVNNSLRMTFVIDRTKPAVSVSCSPSAATVGDTVTCTCTTSDEYPGSGRLNGWGFSGSNPTESTTATGSGTFTSGTCTVLDYAGNRNTATGTWTVTAATSGGGGGGGSGGGSSSGATGQFEQKTWTSINTGETATVEVENGVIGVTAVSFAVTDTVYGAWVKVEKESALPSTVSSFSGDTYRVIEITKGTALKDDKFTKATIDFKVEKKWLADNDLGKERVALHRFADGKWNELPTTVGQDDGTYVHYKAETPGFSYFVIGEKKTAAAPVAPAEEVPVEEALAEVPAEEAPVEEAAEVTKKTKVWSFVAVLLVIAAIVVILVALKKRK